MYNKGGKPLYMDGCHVSHLGLELRANRSISALSVLVVEIGASQEGNDLVGAWALASGRTIGMWAELVEELRKHPLACRPTVY